MEDNINKGRDQLPLVSERKNFISKGGEGGKPAQQSDKKKQTHFRIEQLSGFGYPA